MAALSIKGLQAAPWGYPLLQDITLAVAAGEVLGLIGPNGAGKSSFLGTLSGDIATGAGQIDLFGTARGNWTTQQLAQKLAVMPQQSPLNFPFSVEEVILLGRIPHSTGIAQDRIIAREVMQVSDTLHLRDRAYTELSGGEKQRVQLARIFAQIWRSSDAGERLLLLDEPTTALDLAHQQLIVRTIRQLASEGCAVIVVAHDFNLIAALADRICVLDRGRVYAEGNPEDVLVAEMFKTVFDVEVEIIAHPQSQQVRVLNL